MVKFIEGSRLFSDLFFSRNAYFLGDFWFFWKLSHSRPVGKISIFKIRWKFWILNFRENKIASFQKKSKTPHEYRISEISNSQICAFSHLFPNFWKIANFKHIYLAKRTNSQRIFLHFNRDIFQIRNAKLWIFRVFFCNFGIWPAQSSIPLDEGRLYILQNHEFLYIFLKFSEFWKIMAQYFWVEFENLHFPV